MDASATDIQSVGYGQANHAAVQRVSGNDSKQSGEKHHQVSNKLQTDGQPSADTCIKNHKECTKNAHVKYTVVVSC